MVNDAIPFYEDGDELTCVVVGTAVQGQHFVMIVADLASDTVSDTGLISIGPATAGAKVLGVAMWDAAVGQKVTVHTIDGHHIMPVVNSTTALVANDSVKSGAAGIAVKSTSGDVSCGIALTSCVASGTAMIALARHNAT